MEEERVTVIRFRNVSKRFILKHERARSFQELVLHLLRRNNGSSEELWALQDIDFSVERGDTVGLIGPNGAGKSTVLKLISGIIEPTSGQIDVRGRVGALLELGAGFHPDLTGRENIYLNGSILGLSRGQIEQRLSDIISFAELERFIDMPVKHYSSGMSVRLGFSIAVHTEPEILLVDEVLAVGDIAFQRRCLERINQLRREGVTILLVSHSLEAVRRICRRTIWLEDGQIRTQGATEAVTQQYMLCSYERNASSIAEAEGRRWGSHRVEIEEVRIIDNSGEIRQTFATGDPLSVEMNYLAHQRVQEPVFGLAIHRADGVHVTGPNTHLAGQDIPGIEGRGTVKFTIPALSLLEGIYYLSVSCHNQEETEMFDYHDRLYTFYVVPARRERYGIVTLGGEWSWSKEANELPS